MNVLFKLIASITVSVILVFLGYQNAEQTISKTPALAEHRLEEIQVLKTPLEEPLVPEVDIDQVHCLATNIYHEARGESLEGKVAVANVVINRVKSPKYPDQICDVVYQAVYSTWWWEHHQRKVPVRNRCQFSWFCDGKSDDVRLTDSRGNVIKANLSAWEDSLAVALEAVKGDLLDITEGATHYHANYVQPEWSFVLVQVDTIDNHTFYRTY